MSVTVAINGVTLVPQPAEIGWTIDPNGQKLDGTESLGAYMVATLKAPVMRGGTCNWQTYDNSVLTSIVLPAPFSTQRDSGTTYSSGVVSRAIKQIAAPPGGLVRNVEMEVLVIV